MANDEHSVAIAGHSVAIAGHSADTPRPKTGGQRLPVALVVAVVLVGLQFAMLGVGRFTDLRYFTWAPHDQQTDYQVEVVVDGVELSPTEVHERYGTNGGVDPRGTSHVLKLVEQYETSYGAGDEAEVLVRYSVNGAQEQTWHWPFD